MKKIKLIVCSIVTSLLLETTSGATVVKALNQQVERNGGRTRYETACNLAISNWKQSNNVVLVSGEGYADALSASVLAKKLDAPIILTTSKELNSDARQAIEKLKAKNIYIIGGEGVISSKIRNDLKRKYSLVELKGKDRYKTNINVAEKLMELGVNPSEVIVANGAEGFADSLSVAPIAASNEKILLLVSRDNGDAAESFIKKHNSRSKVIGTTGVVSNNVFRKLKPIERINGGANRFETNLNILKAFNVKESKYICIANSQGKGYADALIASALAAKHDAPLVLLGSENSKETKSALDYIKSILTDNTLIKAIGGKGVLPDSIIKVINNSKGKPEEKPTSTSKDTSKVKPSVTSKDKPEVTGEDKPEVKPTEKPVSTSKEKAGTSVQPKITDEDIVNKAKASLNLNNGVLNNIVSDLKLPKVANNGATITWKSSNPYVIDNNGKVTRPAFKSPDAVVNLTATITKGEKSVNKDFRLIVKAKTDNTVNSQEEFYSAVKEALENFETNVTIKVKNYNNRDYNLKIFNKVVSEHPEIDYGYESVSCRISGYRGSNEKTLNLNIKYRLSKEVMIQEKSAVQAKVKEILGKIIKPGMTSVQKELAIHDYLVENGEYNNSSIENNIVLAEDHNAYGILVKGIGVCESYAKAMHQLCKAAGVECIYVTGMGGNGPHAWNMVRLDDGKWYNVDVTWDDPTYANKNQQIVKVQHKYFNVPDRIMNLDHSRDTDKNYPIADGETYMFDNLNLPEQDMEGNSIWTVRNKEQLDEKIRQAIENKSSKLTVKTLDMNMNSNQLLQEVRTVLRERNINTNGLYTYGITFGGKYVQYNFKYR